MSAEAFLQIKNVVKEFDGHRAVNDVSVDIAKGEVFALLGSSGCGKTTLLRMLAGFETPTSWMIPASSICVSSRSFLSSAPSGSSRSSNCGFLARLRASATRCCCPPESWCGLRFAYGASWTSFSIASTRVSTSGAGRPSRRSPKAMLSNTVRCGKSA